MHERDFGILCENIFIPIFPPNLEGIALFPPALPLRGWCHSDPQSFICDLILSRIVSRIFSLSPIFLNFIVIFFCGLVIVVFFLSQQLNMTLANSCSSFLWNVLNCFFWKWSFPHLLSSLFLDLSCIIQTYHLLWIPPASVPTIVSPFVVCFALCLFLSIWEAFLNCIF